MNLAFRLALEASHPPSVRLRWAADGRTVTVVIPPDATPADSVGTAFLLGLVCAYERKHGDELPTITVEVSQ